MPMDYKLAQKLKDARFPIQEAPLNNPVTLSELIEACGSCALQLFGPNIESLEWFARGISGEQYRKLAQGIGETPEEAVANLWLELEHQRELAAGPIGYVWCAEHKVKHQDFCPECADRDRQAAGHPLE